MYIVSVFVTAYQCHLSTSHNVILLVLELLTG